MKKRSADTDIVIVTNPQNIMNRPETQALLGDIRLLIESARKRLSVAADREIVHALSGQLSWTHFREIIYIEGNLKRDFYAEAKLHEAIRLAREQIAAREVPKLEGEK